ncbi:MULTISPECIES: sulfurtransferase TusA family protein [Sphingobium]|uniref:Redox protein n=1 Tax=Sphingobium baderi TaxID=1332080 RepID=A0A0S3EXZ0_9SPHN|nr:MULTISPECIES: sulfurtransferase TusA family protein [Sphingobium]ALR20287.1 redox protein [Sphingobium baderi]
MPANSAAPTHVNARGMKCPWPALRAARAMRDADAIIIEADDPIAPGELEALAREQGWAFATMDGGCFSIVRHRETGSRP